MGGQILGCLEIRVEVQYETVVGLSFFDSEKHTNFSVRQSSCKPAQIIVKNNILMINAVT